MIRRTTDSQLMLGPADGVGTKIPLYTEPLMSQQTPKTST